MRLLGYECPEQFVSEKIKWISEDLGYPIFKVQKCFDLLDPSAFKISIIVFIVMSDEEETALILKYPPSTFKRI